MAIELGDEVRDMVTGFTGIAVGRTEWINGCARIGVQTQRMDNHKPIDPVWFDEPQLELMQHAKVARGPRDTGGPIPTPQRAADPTR